MDRTEHILSLSYGKDSLACLGAIEQLSWPLDRIIHAEVWATDTIPADLPPMVEFKAKADEIIKRRWGIEVEHYAAEGRERERERATSPCSIKRSHQVSSSVQSEASLWCEEHGARSSNTEARLTYESVFYKTRTSGTHKDQIYGFPMIRGAWCNDRLKMAALSTF